MLVILLGCGCEKLIATASADPEKSSGPFRSICVSSSQNGLPFGRPMGSNDFFGLLFWVTLRPPGVCFLVPDPESTAEAWTRGFSILEF